MFTSVVTFFKGSMLATVLLAGLVGLAVGGTLVLAGTHIASTTSQQGTNDQGNGGSMKDVVARCKAALPAGQHGIGKCVSAAASKNGNATSSGASQKGTKNKNDDGQDASVPTPSTKQSPSTKPSATPSAKP